MFHLFSTQSVKLQWLAYANGNFDEWKPYYIWNSQNFINQRWKKEKNKQCLCGQFLQNWKYDRQTCSKAINYRIFKDTFGFEDYFNILDEKDFLIFCKCQSAILMNLHKLIRFCLFVDDIISLKHKMLGLLCNFS
jgi:hypothetical protein